jgi:hypothetical protein
MNGELLKLQCHCILKYCRVSDWKAELDGVVHTRTVKSKEEDILALEQPPDVAAPDSTDTPVELYIKPLMADG